MIRSPTIDWLQVVAERLGELREDVVFLGGAPERCGPDDPAGDETQHYSEVTAEEKRQAVVRGLSPLLSLV